MGSSGVDDPVANTQITTAWAIALIDALDSAYDDIDVLQAALAGVVTEGDYSDYTLTQTINPTDSASKITTNSYFEGDTRIWLAEAGVGNLNIITVATGALTNTDIYLSSSFVDNDFGASIYGKYYCLVNGSDKTKAYIYKNGVLLKTLTVPDTINDTYDTILMSQTGKYLLIYYRDGSEAGNNRFKYQIWEGS